MKIDKAERGRRQMLKASALCSWLACCLPSVSLLRERLDGPGI